MMQAAAGKNTTMSGEKINNFDILNSVNQEVTQEALMSNVQEELQATAKEEAAKQAAEWEAMQKKADVEDEEDDDDEFDDDVVIAQIQQKRIDELRRKHEIEKEFHAQGHGQYREIVEEEFLKEVCGSKHVALHFYHHEFIRCKVMDQHLRELAKKYMSVKFLHINAEKCPFFVAKLAVQTLPCLIVFEDGVVADRLEGFEALGGKDTFRTEVLELWLSKAGCLKIKAAVEKKALEDSDVESEDSDFD